MVDSSSEAGDCHAHDDGILAPGLVLDERYEIIREIGEGASGVVYQARHRLIERYVAIKVLNVSLKDNADSVQRFVNEGRAAGALGHAHIVESTDMGYTPAGSPYLVLEYLEGRDVFEEVEAVGTLDLGRALRIATQTASALVAAHAQGIIHRDVKPDNIYLVQRLGHDDHVKVLDFGISKFNAAGVTKKGSLYGTAEFMAPEQIVATEMVDARADVYGLGLSLYYMLTGNLPFESLPLQEMLIAVVSAAPKPMRTWRSDLPEAVYELTERCMAKSPEDRYQTMTELESALMQLRATNPDLATSSSRGLIPPPSEESVAVAGASITAERLLPSITRSTVTTAVPPAASNSAPRWFAAIALGAVVVTAAFVAGRMLRSPPSTPNAAVTSADVSLEVESPVGGTMLFRGKQFVLPYRGNFSMSAARERVEVVVPGSPPRTFWLVLDRPRKVTIN